jgi:hypothetical protein
VKGSFLAWNFMDVSISDGHGVAFTWIIGQGATAYRMVLNWHDDQSARPFPDRQYNE